MSAAAVHDAMVAAVREQRGRLGLDGPEGDRWGGGQAQRFRADLGREPDPLLRAVIDSLHPGDVVLDVGGGAGRYAFPLAQHCREVVVVDPSAGMRAGFEAGASELGVGNARFVQADWLEAEPMRGDLSLIVHVTYFVTNIRLFVEKLVAATSRRLVIGVVSIPNPNMNADVFPLVYGEPLAHAPGHEQLLPALWEMGILPDVRVLGVQRPFGDATWPTREAALDGVVTGTWLRASDAGRARDAIENRFEELFVPVEGGYQRRRREQRLMMITWETGPSS